MRWVRPVVRRGRGEVYYRVLVKILEGKRPLGKRRRRCKNNIKLYLQDVECVCTDWMSLSQGRAWWKALVNEGMNIRAP
jgi:hypothetical protein